VGLQIQADASRALSASQGGTEALGLIEIIQQIQEMTRYVNNLRDASGLVRRASATGKLINEALKTCQVISEEQFALRQAAAEAHLRTQRRAGELLSGCQLNPGGRPPKTDSKMEGVRDAQSLRDMGIEAHESHRWQRIASIPKDLFETYIAEARHGSRELTTSGAIALARRIVSDRRDESTNLDARPSGQAALVAEYGRIRRELNNLVWLDPLALAQALSPDLRSRWIQDLARYRRWLMDFERSLQKTA
jgi:hypothetical protein